MSLKPCAGCREISARRTHRCTPEVRQQRVRIQQATVTLPRMRAAKSYSSCITTTHCRNRAMYLGLQTVCLTRGLQHLTDLSLIFYVLQGGGFHEPKTKQNSINCGWSLNRDSRKAPIKLIYARPVRLPCVLSRQSEVELLARLFQC